MKIKRFNEKLEEENEVDEPQGMDHHGTIWAQIYTVGELKEFIKKLPDDMGIVASVDGGGSSDFSFGAYSTDFDYPDQQLLRIDVS